MSPTLPFFTPDISDTLLFPVSLFLHWHLAFSLSDRPDNLPFHDRSRVLRIIHTSQSGRPCHLSSVPLSPTRLCCPCISRLPSLFCFVARTCTTTCTILYEWTTLTFCLSCLFRSCFALSGQCVVVRDCQLSPAATYTYVCTCAVHATYIVLHA